MHHQALLNAHATGNRAGEMDAVAGLDHIHRLRGRYPQAADHFEQVLRIAGPSVTASANGRQLVGIDTDKKHLRTIDVP
nr:hypothetical protein [Dactylosporangium siamense]